VYTCNNVTSNCGYNLWVVNKSNYQSERRLQSTKHVTIYIHVQVGSNFVFHVGRKQWEGRLLIKNSSLYTVDCEYKRLCNYDKIFDALAQIIFIDNEKV
jgi:hypothetical protein